MKTKKPIKKKTWIKKERLDELQKIDKEFASQVGKIQKISYKIGQLGKSCNNKDLYNYCYKFNTKLASVTDKDNNSALASESFRKGLFKILLNKLKAMVNHADKCDKDMKKKVFDWMKVLADEIYAYIAAE